MKKTLSKGSNSFFTNEETKLHKGRKIPLRRPAHLRPEPGIPKSRRSALSADRLWGQHGIYMHGLVHRICCICSQPQVARSTWTLSYWEEVESTTSETGDLEILSVSLNFSYFGWSAPPKLWLPNFLDFHTPDPQTLGQWRAVFRALIGLIIIVKMIGDISLNIFMPPILF